MKTFSPKVFILAITNVSGSWMDSNKGFISMKNVIIITDVRY